MKLILLRHGETRANRNNILSGWTDYDLTLKGKLECKKVEKEISTNFKNIKKIYSSTLNRAVLTAQYINKNLNRKIIKKDVLKEMNFGIFEGKNKTQITNDHSEEWNKWKTDYVNYRIPDGESVYDLKNRINPFLDEVVFNNEDIIIVSHKAVIQVMITILLDIELSKMWNFDLKNSRYVEIDIKNEKAFIKKIN